MKRMIVIATCRDCPFNAHEGGFGTVKYIPTCRMAKRRLPYGERASNGVIHAVPEETIPDWCPLPIHQGD